MRGQSDKIVGHGVSGPSLEESPDKLVVVTAENHDVSLAVCAGVLLLGAGQLYNGQTAKGSALVALALAGAVFMALEARNAAVVIVGLMVGLILYTITVIDAGVIAGRLIRREPVRPWDWFWNGPAGPRRAPEQPEPDAD